MQHPPYHATTSSMRSRQSERSLTASAQAVSGAAPLPAFLTPYRTRTGDPEAICLPRRARRRDSRKWPTKPGGFPFFLAFSFKRERENPSTPKFMWYLAIHFTQTQKPSIRGISALHVAVKLERYAAQTRVRRERPRTMPHSASLTSRGRSRLTVVVVEGCVQISGLQTFLRFQRHFFLSES
jgi:hypothetical protein